MKGLKDHQAAAVEAREEAGLTGSMRNKPDGSYTYWRRTERDYRLTTVSVFVMKVEVQRRNWKERYERDRRWFTILEAADLVLEPELSTLIIHLPLNEDVRQFLSQGAPTQVPRDVEEI